MPSHPLRPEWVQEAVFYEIFPDRFCNGDPSNDPPGTESWGAKPTRENFLGGDLAGICQKLSYLEELGVSAIYLTPIFMAGTNHRYDTWDYLRIDAALGDVAQLKELVTEAHGRRMRVILDGVFNHCGDGFWAFRDLARQGAQSPYKHWFFPAHFPIEQDPPNYQTCGGAAYLPKLNTQDPDLRRYLLQVATYWLEEVDIDGWRLDVPWKVPLDFWEELRRTVKEVNPEAYLVGEIWRDAGPWLDVFDGVMNYRLRDHLLDYCVRDAMDAEDFVFESKALLTDHSGAAPCMMNLLGSHDTPRLLTLCGGDSRRAMLALTALFTAPGAPMLYYGDEIGLEGENDPDCRRAMIWEEEQWNRAMWRTCQALIRTRRGSAALQRGTWEPLLELNAVLAYRRRYESDEAIVVLNPRGPQRQVRIPVADGRAGAWSDLLTGRRYSLHDGCLTIEAIEACSALILTPLSKGIVADE